ncbi:MAG: HAD-IIA family hydrolase [Actinomycetota bacterium]
MILAQGFSRFVLDLDGVLWTGDEPIPGATATIMALREAGRRLAFCTNNSSLLPEHYARKLARMKAGGDPNEVITSAHATARLLQNRFPDLRGRTAFVIGGVGLQQAVSEQGVHVLEGQEATNTSMVVVGLDTKLTYEKLRIATIAIRAGAAFIASNDDPTFPAEEGLRPGAGAIVASLRASTGAEPDVAGKPKPYMLELAKDRLGGAPALVIGDRIGTDILAARAIDWPCALVLTGVTSVADLATASVWPDAVLRGLPDLLEDLPHPTIRQATGPDLPGVAHLLHEGSLQAGNVRERAGRTIVAEAGRKEMLGTAAWDPVGSAAILRSIAVRTQSRGKGVGLLLVAGALRTAFKAGVREAWLVTTDAQAFFKRCGFTEINREDVPDEVAAHPQISRECPATASVMRLILAETV